MGFQLKETDPTVDFSSFGLGNVNLSETYLQNAGTTTTTQKAAIRAFYNSFKAAGFYNKFGVARLFYLGTSLGDSLNLLNPVPGVSAKQATYVNDAADRHTSAGWTPNGATGHYAQSNFSLNGDGTFFHMHAWNVTPEATDVASRFIMGSQGSTSNHQLQIGRRIATTATRVDIGTFTPATPLGVGGDTAGVGLISAARNGASLKMYKNGAMAAQLTKSDTPVFGVATMKEGVVDSSATTSYTATTLRFIGYGFSTWTDADELALKNMLDAFNTAIS